MIIKQNNTDLILAYYPLFFYSRDSFVIWFSQILFPDVWVRWNCRFDKNIDNESNIYNVDVTNMPNIKKIYIYSSRGPYFFYSLDKREIGILY